jgi:hypothetical protein
MPAPFRWAPLLIKLTVSVLVVLCLFALLKELLKVALGVLCQLFMLMVLASAILGMMTGGHAGLQGSQLITRLISQLVFGLFRMRPRYWGQPYRPQQVAVLNVTLLDAATGRQVLVRIEGDVVGGDPAPLHEIEIEGSEHHGTILFRSGVNLTLGLQGHGTEIRVEPPPLWY